MLQKHSVVPALLKPVWFNPSESQIAQHQR